VAGDDATVQSLLTSKGPHDYEFRATDARKLRNADLFFINGLGLDEKIANRLSETANNPKLKTVELGESVPEADLIAAGKHEHGAGEHAGHDHGAHDPHVWMGIPEAIYMVQSIRAHLAGVDPAHAAGYKQRADALSERLLAFQATGKDALAKKSEKARVLAQHDALRYFARSFGIDVVGSIELPGHEPNAQRLAELVSMCKDQKVRLIAVEPQYPSNTAAKAILRELERKDIWCVFVEIDPMETADPADLTADFYERRMQANLDNLLKALK
jgi:ABC-type Zn uptake system ZnuABC Zn-binding protein ZnuA